MEATATPDANLVEKTKEIVEEVLTLPVLSEQFEVLSEDLLSLRASLTAIGIVELLLMVAVLYLLWKQFKG